VEKGGDLQMWKVMDELNKLAQITDKGWRPILRFEKGANNVDHYISWRA
jgi:hypothetical protein